ncbi:BolA family transcriptional regulator [Mycoavidus sp. B2-EB]|uniref:BolA family protein n=1 Tax=Mycoavidus sp. B2-EB TaxID=2651972 RepID=UPI001624FBE4|nr:BolA family protein [Mycoavidus sp. B2-EB]BBO59874.1 BolA family transcriptional regulator [Mycoavidus sp. B2-EB]
MSVWSDNPLALIETRLRDALEPNYLRVDDDGAQHIGHAGAKSGGHFSVTVVAQRFAGKTRIARHRLIYDALADAMQGAIHALVIADYTPEEFDTLSDNKSRAIS